MLGGARAVPVTDPRVTIEDLSVHIEDDDVRTQAVEIERVIGYKGSKILAAAWTALLGCAAAVFGAVTLSPVVRSSTLSFILYLAGALVALRFTFPISKRLFDDSIASATAFAMFWAFCLGASAVLGARLDSPFWGYVASGVLGALFGLMWGSFAPDLVGRDDIYMFVALLLAPVTCLAGTYVARAMSPMTDLPAAAAAGMIAGGVISVATALVVATTWNSFNGLLRLGTLYLHNENFSAKAVEALSQAIALRPADARLYNLRGIAYSKLKDEANATADLEKAAELAPNDPEPAMNRGVDHLERGEYDQAIAALTLALKINPKAPKAESNLGIAYERRGDLDAAIQHYDEAIRQAPKHANAYSNRGYAYHLKGDYQRALDDCDRALKLRSDLVPAMVNRGHALAGLGRIDEAIASYEDALESGGDATFHDEALKALEKLTGEPRDDGP